MSLRHVAIACVASITLGFAAQPAQAQQASPAFERAVLDGLDAATRADVERRATAGNTVLAVIGTTLINNYYGAGARTPGEALTIVAIDFAQGVVVLRRAPNVFEVERFDPRTLRIMR